MAKKEKADEEIWVNRFGESVCDNEVIREESQEDLERQGRRPGPIIDYSDQENITMVEHVEELEEIAKKLQTKALRLNELIVKETKLSYNVGQRIGGAPETMSIDSRIVAVTQDLVGVHDLLYRVAEWLY